MNLLQIKEAIAANKKDCPGFGNIKRTSKKYFEVLLEWLCFL